MIYRANIKPSGNGYVWNDMDTRDAATYIWETKVGAMKDYMLRLKHTSSLGLTDQDVVNCYLQGKAIHCLFSFTNVVSGENTNNLDQKILEDLHKLQELWNPK